MNYDAQSANFNVGSRLTGGTSGATGIIYRDTDGGATGTLELTGITGTFQNNETITDDGSTPVLPHQMEQAHTKYLGQEVIILFRLIPITAKKENAQDWAKLADC